MPIISYCHNFAPNQTLNYKKMKNKLFYLVGIALLMCSTGMFTSCINGVDDEYLELAGSGNGEGGTDEEDDSEAMNGEYYDGGDFDLIMTYNGEELTGRKVTFMLNEDKASATMTLAGTEKDLSSLHSILDGMNATFTTYSPIPGEKEVLLNNVKVYLSGSDCIFEGEDIKPNRIVKFKGTILNEIMTIDINHVLAREENDLLGKWRMGDAKEGGSVNIALSSNNDPNTSSPLWLDWGSNKNVDMGEVSTGIPVITKITVNRPMNGIFNLLMSDLVSEEIGKMANLTSGIEKSIPKLIEFVAAENTGGMYASYSYNGTDNPLYSQEMSHNIMRYYFDEDNKLRIEANADYLLKVIGDLIKPATSNTTVNTRAELQPDEAKVLGKELISKLRPALEKGIPCEYSIDHNNMTINIDGLYLLDVMRAIEKLINEPYIKNEIEPTINSIGDYAKNVKLLLANLHNALDNECKYIKLGFRMVKIEETPAP